MAVVILAAKSILAVTLLVAAGAKLADMSSFAGTLRLFIPRQFSSKLIRTIATLMVSGELALGAMSLALPAISWINYMILAVCFAFVTVSAVGYARFRGRTCQCFGALSQRRFDLRGIGRSAVLLVLAVAALGTVQSASVQLEIAPRLLLLAVALLLAASAFVAARAVGVVKEA